MAKKEKDEDTNIPEETSNDKHPMILSEQDPKQQTVQRPRNTSDRLGTKVRSNIEWCRDDARP